MAICSPPCSRTVFWRPTPCAGGPPEWHVFVWTTHTYPGMTPSSLFPARSSSRIHATTASPEKIRTLMIPGMHREEAIAALRSHFPAHPPRLRRTTHCPAWVYGARRGPRGALGRRVDLVTPDALKPRMRPIVGCTTVDVGGTTVMSRKAELERSRRVVREGRDWTGPSKKGAHEEGPY